MPATVHFATNRVLDGPADQVGSYSESVVAPSNANEVTYGTAFVNDANLTADTIGAITSIQTIGKGQFSPERDRRSERPRPQPAGLHPRLRQQLRERHHPRRLQPANGSRASGLSQAETSVVAFSWPSAGKLISLPFPSAAYRRDQTMAGQSGLHIMTFFANLEPIIASARAKGNRVFLLAHSMGNWALQAAVESWFAHGNGDALLFDEVILAAADEIHSSFEFLPAGRLSALEPPGPAHLDLCQRQGCRARHQHEDQLAPSAWARTGRTTGPTQEHFPSDKYRTVDVRRLHRLPIDIGSSHQYYRRSPGVRHGHRQHDGGERLIRPCLTRSAGKRIRTLLRPLCLCLAWPCARRPARPVCLKLLAAG